MQRLDSIVTDSGSANKDEQRLQREISDTRRLLAEEAATSPSRITLHEDINDDTGSFGRLELPHTGGSGKRKYRRHPKVRDVRVNRPEACCTPCLAAFPEFLLYLVL